MPRCYVYVVDRDFGFAPNPFHGVCTLATCKPRIRARARPGDWVVGMGGRRLNATGRCIFAMKVSNVISFDDYWHDPTFRDKRPVRNGSHRMLVGDNIYHKDGSGKWVQADSHHSNPDGSANVHNINQDTKADRVLLSTHFYYFGRVAPEVPRSVIDDLGYRNLRDYRVYENGQFDCLIRWLDASHGREGGRVCADPFDFDISGSRYSVAGNRLT
jgi:hypothetical protein